MKKPPRTRIFWYLVAAAIVAAIIVITLLSGKIVEWLWMGQLGYGQVFWKLLSVKVLLFVLTFAVVFVYFWINLHVAFKNDQGGGRQREVGILYSNGGTPLPPIVATAIPIVVSFFLALIFGLIFYHQWDTYLRFRWGGAFGAADPIFGRDMGFYLFRLPFYEMIQNGVVGLTISALLITGMVYFYGGGLQFGGGSRRKNRPMILHLSVMALFFFAAMGWGYYLDRFELLYSTRGVVYGAGYTDVHIVRIGLWIMFFASAALMALILINIFVLKRPLIVGIGIGVYFALIVVVIALLPGIVQRFTVDPNELELEQPYIKYNIEFTRLAYQLDRIEERDYPALSDLTLAQVSENQDTLRNIRLWDWRPIRQTFRQTQEIRLYYKFYEVDVDRYRLGGEEGYRQVMLSARELSEQLPSKARTWVNQRLQYTHGYGLAMSLVAEKTEEGLPRYVVKDLPPVSPYLSLDRPAIYYGEGMPGYRIVNTKIQEFDYPRGDENVYVSYQGNGGVPMDNLWKRILFAWTESDISILLSSYITPESRIQIWRRIQEQVARIAPFLKLDRDPYVVLSGGKLYWIQDAYTISSRFPYADPYQRGLNYIRNSVKIVVDAYEGSVTFYVMDPDDPVLGVYRQTFPNLFAELDAMPQDLQAHLRYPEDLFTIQADKFRTYHMTIPQVFYNQEDLWTWPQEKYAGSAIEMEPYYILMRLPGEKQLQYLIMTPLTPENRDNMIAWVAAKSDFPDYGKLVVYKLSKDRLIYGPLQIEAMIDQDDVISQQLSLWDQRGSQVIRGNLLVIPVGNSFIYVEPVYLIAEQTDIPQLKRVIVVYGKEVVMEPTLQEAVEAVFGARRTERGTLPSSPVRADVFKQAREHLQRAEDALRRGDWSGFGKAMDSLKKLLEK
jgi:uncharacterized membrane protein (UPF0182 family)